MVAGVREGGERRIEEEGLVWSLGGAVEEARDSELERL